MARIIIVAVSCFVIAAVAMGRLSFADNIDSGKENSVKIVGDAEMMERDGEERLTPAPFISIPQTFEYHDGGATGTLELRLKNNICRSVAQLVELASKCQIVSSAPLKLK